MKFWVVDIDYLRDNYGDVTTAIDYLRDNYGDVTTAVVTSPVYRGDQYNCD